jgi:hypothetical protein
LMLVHEYLIAPYAKGIEAWISTAHICTYKQPVNVRS